MMQQEPKREPNVKELLHALYEKGKEKGQTSEKYIQQIIPMIKPLLQRKD
ncbi:hypothetical protein EDD68_102197 [Melghiribacillus thermohalophilus]|uniref:Uncharacterized protein n=1 Tax=Melghiribacillus thermohalophilus TaxID=1324956 RepID=A0A4R3NCK4_9BACI|nr:hypothetical protein EDD68_102197 [Melghiribacillus thermohalophilus]